FFWSWTVFVSRFAVCLHFLSRGHGRDDGIAGLGERRRVIFDFSLSRSRLRPSFNLNPHPAFGHPLPAGEGKIPSPAWRRCRAAADEGGQRLGQYHPSPGLRLGSCEVGPDSQIGRQPFISLFFF